LAHVLYRLGPLFRSDSLDRWVSVDPVTIIFLLGLPLLGALGAVASMRLSARKPSFAPSFKPRPPSGF
jgi:hypothetical protein